MSDAEDSNNNDDGPPPIPGDWTVDDVPDDELYFPTITPRGGAHRQSRTNAFAPSDTNVALRGHVNATPLTFGNLLTVKV